MFWKRLVAGTAAVLGLSGCDVLTQELNVQKGIILQQENMALVHKDAAFNGNLTVYCADEGHNPERILTDLYEACKDDICRNAIQEVSGQATAAIHAFAAYHHRRRATPLSQGTLQPHSDPNYRYAKAIGQAVMANLNVTLATAGENDPRLTLACLMAQHIGDIPGACQVVPASDSRYVLNVQWGKRQLGSPSATPQR